MAAGCVRRAIKSGVDGGWVAGPPKTHQNRVFALDGYIVAGLQEHRSGAEGWAEQAGVIISPTEYVLTFDPSGAEPLEPDSLGQAFGRLCRHAGVEDLLQVCIGLSPVERRVIPSIWGRWSSSSPRPLTARPHAPLPSSGLLSSR